MVRTVGLMAALALAAAAWGFELNCACDAAQPETLQVRQCSLCSEAEKQPHSIFFLKDVSPRKPNRWLALPKRHLDGGHHLDELAPADRLELWTAAVEKAKQMWGDAWGIAYNGPNVRTQCHTHLHIGKFLPAAERAGFKVVNSLRDLPAPKGVGMWVHPVDGKFHVHTGEQITETVLLR